MESRVSRLAQVVIFVLLLGLLASSLVIAPTPEVADAANPVVRLGGTGIATTTTYAGGPWPVSPNQEPTIADVFLILEEPTLNTVTVDLQVSPNGSNWFTPVSTSTLWPALLTDTNTVSRTNLQGVAFRIIATLANTETVTPTFYVVTH